MTSIGDTLARVQQDLALAGIEDAHLEAQLLLMATLGKDRAALYASFSQPLTAAQTHALDLLLERRFKREPLFHILGRREFYGVELHVAPGVLIPRPETETLVEEAIRIVRGRFHGACTLVDVGTGCGAIAVALAVNLPHTRVYATDISPQALTVAAANVQRYGLAERVTLLEGDLLALVPEPVDAVVANLPYVRSDEIAGLPPEIRLYEPREALDGGPDGLDVIRRLLRQTPAKLKPSGAVLLEIDPRQVAPLRTEIAQRFPDSKMTVVRDLSGRERVVVTKAFSLALWLE